MTDPQPVDPTDAWAHLFFDPSGYTRSRSRQEWAQVADAIQAADRDYVDRSLAADNPFLPRGDTAWCQVAVDIYTRVHTAGTHADRQPATSNRIHADAAHVRAWLDAPHVGRAGAGRTVAQATGWDVTFRPGRLPDPDQLTILVDVAQQVGVFGAPGHRVSLLRWVQDGITRDDTFVVSVSAPGAPARGSSPVDIRDLVPSGWEPSHVVAGVLYRVAEIANGLLDAPTPQQVPPHRVRSPAPPTEAAGRSPWQGWPTGDPARGFPPLRLDTSTTTPGSPPAPPPQPDTPHPHR